MRAMRTIGWVAAALVVAAGCAEAPQELAPESLAAALARATRQKKSVLIEFSAIW